MTGQTNTVWKRKGEKGFNLFKCVFYTKTFFLLNGGQSLISTGLVVSLFFFTKELKTKCLKKNEKIRNEKKDINLLTVQVMMGNKCSFLVVKR